MDWVTHNKHIAFAGGSTGGHVVPISTLIQTIWEKHWHTMGDGHLFRFGERGSLEEEAYQKLKAQWVDLFFVHIVSGKIRRHPSIREFFQNIWDIFLCIYWILISFYNLNKYHIDVIFCKGWFVSLPVVVAWRLLWIQIITHESDSKPGLSTRIAAKFSSKVFSWFPNTLPWAEYIWQILSDNLLVGNKTWDFDNKKPHILVNCGSLGSASVHEALLSLFVEYPLLTQDYCRTILLGRLNIWYKSSYEQLREVVLYEYVDQTIMGELYWKADISICRGGSTTLVEQHIFNIRQIIIPIPWTHDQAGNASFFETTYWDIVIDQSKKGWSKKLYQSILYFGSLGTKPSLDRDLLKTQIIGSKEKIIEELLRR